MFFLSLSPRWRTERRGAGNGGKERGEKGDEDGEVGEEEEEVRAKEGRSDIPEGMGCLKGEEEEGRR